MKPVTVAIGIVNLFLFLVAFQQEGTRPVVSLEEAFLAWPRLLSLSQHISGGASNV